MSGRLARVLSVLEVFGEGEPGLSAEQICTRAGLPVATGYRHIRDLCEVGLLVKLPHGYTPGPRIIEWDYMVRSNDPVLAAAREPMDRLVAETGLELLLSQLYGERIVNTHYEHQAGNAPLLLGRGRVMPMFRGSTARVILAHLASRTLRRLYDTHAAEAEVQTIGADWKAFSKALAEVRREGFARSAGELLTGRTGIAAPIFGDKGHVLGSLTLIGTTARLDAFRPDYISQHVVQAAQEITRRLAQ